MLRETHLQCNQNNRRALHDFREGCATEKQVARSQLGGSQPRAPAGAESAFLVARRGVPARDHAEKDAAVENARQRTRMSGRGSVVR